MPKSTFEPCIPTRATAVPNRPEWIHEIKHDGYRLIVQRDGKRVRLFTRNGHDWSDRFPLIIRGRAAQPQQLVRDRRRGRAARRRRPHRDFNGLHSAQARYTRSSSTPSTAWRSTATISARLPLSMRKTNLARLLARRVDGIHPGVLRAGRDRPGPVPARLPDGALLSGAKLAISGLLPMRCAKQDPPRWRQGLFERLIG